MHHQGKCLELARNYQQTKLRTSFSSVSAATSVFIATLLFELVYFPSQRWWWQEAKLWHSGSGVPKADLSFKEQKLQTHFKEQSHLETLDSCVHCRGGPVQSCEQGLSRYLLISMHTQTLGWMQKWAYNYFIPGKATRWSPGPSLKAEHVLHKDVTLKTDLSFPLVKFPPSLNNAVLWHCNGRGPCFSIPSCIHSRRIIC